MEGENCRKCNDVLPCKKTLAWHVLEEHENVTMLLCPQQECSATFRRFQSLDDHLRSHQTKLEKKAVEDDADTGPLKTALSDKLRSSATRQKFKQHMRALKNVNTMKKRIRGKSYECPKCLKMCANLGDFNAHVSYEHKGPPFDEAATCVQCKISFRGPHDLMRHNQSAHLKVYRYNCDKCPKKYTRLEVKQQHERKCNPGIVRKYIRRK